MSFYAAVANAVRHFRRQRQGGSLGDYVDPATPDTTVARTLTASEVERFVAGDLLLTVHSSNVATATYDPVKEELTLSFKDGGIYVYSQVSEQEALSFAQASSKGTWVWSFLRIRGTATGARKPFRKL